MLFLPPRSSERIDKTMSITIGIDIGGSTTKIVGIQNGRMMDPLLVRANDPIASLFGAFGKFIASNNLKLHQVEQIMVTGVGASYLDQQIYGIPTGKVEEFLANGLGGLHLSGLNKAIIVSMGTGTAFVRAEGEDIYHIGGTGIGGGTILGLSNRMLNIRDIQLLIKTAEGGNLDKVDLMVGDITQDHLPTLPAHTTASNFGKISDLANASDIALGILNMVFQSIGMSAIFAIRNEDIHEIVLIGNLTTIPQAHPIFQTLSDLYNVNFIIAPNSEFGTAVGAALAYTGGHRFLPVGE